MSDSDALSARVDGIVARHEVVGDDDRGRAEERVAADLVADDRLAIPATWYSGDHKTHACQQALDQGHTQYPFDHIANGYGRNIGKIIAALAG